MKKGALAVVAGTLFFFLLGNAPAVADTLSGTFSTSGFGSQYYVVVWVKNQADQFVKTLSVWGNARNTGYWSQMPEWDTKAKKNIVDAVTSATLNGNKTGLKFSWNGTDTSRKKVPNGTYTLQIESTENNNKISTSKTPIVFDGTSKTLTGNVTSKLTNISIKITSEVATSILDCTTGHAVRTPPWIIRGTTLIIPNKGNFNGSVGIFTLDGSQVAHWAVPASQAISLASIKPGLYVMKLKSGHEGITGRIVISGSGKKR